MTPLSAWPWHHMNNYKYVLYMPIAVGAWAGSIPASQNVCLHIMLITGLRLTIYHLWQIFSRFLPIVSHLQIRPDSLSYRQVDREWHCDNPQLLQALMLYGGHKWLGLFENVTVWNAKGLLFTLVLHIGPVEMLYYCLHRALHTNYLFHNYHKLHHESVTPEPSTAGSSTFLEQMLIAMVMGVAVVGGSVMGGGASLVSLYAYLLLFDFLRAFGHSNVEVVPPSLFRSFPFLKYVLYTPSYHTLHHVNQESNYCLFMPLYDYLGKTIDPKTESFHAQNRLDRGKERVPDYVFLLHVVDFPSSLHAHFLFRSYASKAYSWTIFLLPFLPVVPLFAMGMWMWAKVFRGWNYYIRDRHHQIWLVPRFGFMYFLPSVRNINNLIESAILEADRIGVKVLSLAALNKNEALNGGGKLFVMKHPNLKVRVCHGNTLTAAVIVKEIPEHVKEVFLTGATSKLGRAIALYLCRRGVRVLMLTASRNRFEAIAMEAPCEVRCNLVQVTKHQAGKNCKAWVLGKWLTYSQQMLAPSGTHFHQFVVPPVIPFRGDCTYGKLAAMKLPDDARGLACCEYTLDRNVVHACHAGGVVHALEGWTHHEVGALDVDRIDLVWEAALRHGFLPV